MVPLLFIIGLIWKDTPDNYKKVGLDSVVGLIIGIYIITVLIFHLLEAYRAWKNQDKTWRMTLAVILAIVFCFTIIFVILAISPLQYVIYDLIGDVYGMFLIFFILSFLFVIGVTSLVFGFMSLRFIRTHSKGYIVTNFIVGGLFTIIGTIPALMVALYFINGPNSILPPCYCPVNRKTKARELVLRPIYNYRKAQLRRRLWATTESI